MTGLRLSPVLLSAALVLAAAACGRGPENAAAPSPAAPAHAPATTPAAPATAAPTTAAPSPIPTVTSADAAEMRKAIVEFTLTDKTLDAIIASEKELGDFWANPEQAMKIRGERNLGKILAAIDASPRLRSTLTRHGLSGREYILGTFSTIAGFMWEKAKAQNPALLKGQTQPVSDASLAVIHRRLDDVTKLLSPPKKPARTPRAHENNDY